MSMSWARLSRIDVNVAGKWRAVVRPPDDLGIRRTGDRQSPPRATTGDESARSLRFMLTDPRRFSRLIAAFALIVGPLVVLAGMIATPWEDEATTASYHDALAAHPGQAEIAATLLHFGYLLLLPAALGIMHLARRASPKLAHIGGLLSVLGLATLPGLLVTDFYDLALAQHLPREQSVLISDATQDSWAAAVMGLSAIAPMFFGLIILMVAASRAGITQRWAPVASAIAWLLPFVSGTGLIPAVAGATIILGMFGAIGLKVARMSDQAWAERPAGRVRTKRAKAPKIAAESAA
jgi:hypothetical protein